MNPCVWCSANPNNTFMVRQHCTAASLTSPHGAALVDRVVQPSHVASLSKT